jgi:hypothetical protein
MVVRQGRRLAGRRVKALLAIGSALAFAATASGASSWCLGLGSLGPIRTGMTVDEVLRLADFPGQERKKPVSECWYLRYHGNGSDFDLMIIGGRVVRIELKGESKLRTMSGAGLGDDESDLMAMFGSRLESQPHKYVENGHTITFKSSAGDYGLRFETSSGKVTAIQSGPWEHLNYVEGCG